MNNHYVVVMRRASDEFLNNMEDAQTELLEFAHEREKQRLFLKLLRIERHGSVLLKQVKPGIRALCLLQYHRLMRRLKGYHLSGFCQNEMQDRADFFDWRLSLLDLDSDSKLVGEEGISPVQKIKIQMEALTYGIEILISRAVIGDFGEGELCLDAKILAAYPAV
ncbi:hypothetical protein [Persicobacter diffluens]|uniref:Uncharacterized protein n=1 Tax=Persicobacter diffluens TaxID=981 RepID=A0AAN4VXB5_9BACT|nr:hypothetical protein PEDI_12880 [Persicobacter diffluens]